MPAGQGEVGVEGEMGSRVSVKFVQDSSRFWYKPGISREQGEKTTVLMPSNHYPALLLIALDLCVNRFAHANAAMSY